MYFNGALDPVSNCAGWTQLFEIVDQDTGEPVDLTGASAAVEIRDPRYGTTALSATTQNGRVALVDTGTIQVSFPASETQGLCADTYEVGAILTLNGETRQLIIGTLPVLDGIVTQ